MQEQELKYMRDTSDTVASDFTQLLVTLHRITLQSQNYQAVHDDCGLQLY